MGLPESPGRPYRGFKARARHACLLGLLVTGPAPGAEDPGTRTQQQLQLQRQQQQEALQLRLQQHQRAVQPASGAARQSQGGAASPAEQRQQLDQLHYRQEIRPATAQPSDDEAARRARTEMEQEKAQRESERERERLNTDGPSSRRP